jgi:hypothetical protein
MRRRLLPLAFLALLAFLVTACGSTSNSSSSISGGSPPAGASLVRPGVLAFVSIDSDTGSSQWQQLDKLAQKFPGRDQALQKLQQSFSKHGVDWSRDVKPALGPEVDVAVAGGGNADSTTAVALTKPDDPGAFKALVTKLNASDSSGSNAVYREVDGWYALSNSQAAITRVLKGTDSSLADDATFKQAMAKLPGEALARLYVDGAQVNALVSKTAASSGGSLGTATLGLDTLKYAAASATAEDDGVRIHGASSGGPSGGGDFASKLVGGVPGDAFALLSLNGAGTSDQLGKLRSNPQFGAAVKELDEYLGVPLDDVLSLLHGELAFYARPGALIPELTLVLDPQNQATALATLDKLAARLALVTPARVESGTQDGHEVKTVNFGQFAIHYGGTDGKVVITSGSNGIAEYGGSSGSLPDSADFKEAKDAAGMPDSTGGVAYVDLKDALPLIEGFATLSGKNIPSDVTDNLRPLRSFLSWSQGPPDERTYDAFLEIK